MRSMSSHYVHDAHDAPGPLAAYGSMVSMAPMMSMTPCDVQGPSDAHGPCNVDDLHDIQGPMRPTGPQ